MKSRSSSPVREFQDTDAAGMIVVLDHPQLAVPVNGDATRHDHAGGVVGAEDRAPAGRADRPQGAAASIENRASSWKGETW